MSGTSENLFTFMHELNITTAAYAVANGRGYNKSSIDDLVEYYKGATTAELLELSNPLKRQFLPTIESL